MYCHKATDNSINSLKNASTADQSKLYFKLKLKHRIAAQNAWFTQQCLKNSVFPQFVQVKCRSNSTSSKKAVKIAKITWLKEESRKWFQQRDSLFLHVKVLHSELTYKLHPVEFDILDDTIRSKISDIIHKKYLIQLKKIKNLIDIKNKLVSQPNVTHPKQFYKRFINLSNVEFSTSQTTILEKGPKYNPPTSKIILETIVSEIEVSLPNNEQSNLPKEQIKNIIKQSTKFPLNSPQEQIHIKSLQQKIKSNDLSVTKADKGNSIVILNKEQYINKVKDFLKKEKPVKLKSDPTEKIQNKLKTTLKEVKAIFDDKEKFKLINKNPSAPNLYGLIKIHKEGNPIRPVVSYTNTPLRNTAVKLNILFKEITKFEPKFTVKNSIELTNKLKNITLPNNSILASFDVTNMFSNIPNTECINIINDIFTKSRINPVTRQEFLLLLNLCINENYFEFNGEYFKQTDGLAMGSPLSPLLAEIFMSNFEEKFLNLKEAKNIFFWYRYVDDILVCFKGNSGELKMVLNILNSIHPKIKFTLEEEQDNSINFLDITIKKSNNHLLFDIYRKPTYTDTTIPKDSLHPMSHKLAAYRSMIHRAFSIPLEKTDLDRELNIIRSIAANNGYNVSEINKLISKKRTSLTTSLIYPKIKTPPKKYTTLTYFGQISNKIANILKKNENNSIAFKSSQKLSNMIFNVKSKKDKFKKSGVYRLKCNECNSLYIGQTGRNFNTRYKEHYASYRLKKQNSNFANHFLETSHNFPGINSLNILHYEQKGKKLDCLEAIEIYKNHKDPNINLLNLQTDIKNSTLLSLFDGNKNKGKTPNL